MALAAGPDGHAVVAWQVDRAVFAAVRDPGGRFLPAVQLATPPPVPTGPNEPAVPITEPFADLFEAPAVAIGPDGRAVVAWSRQDPLTFGTHDIAIAEAPPGSPFTTHGVARAPGRISGLSVAAGPAGELTAVWQRSGSRVFVEALIGADVTPVTLSTPRVAVEGGTLSMAATADGHAIAAWVERDADRLAARVMLAERSAHGRFGAARALQTVRGRATATDAAIQPSAGAVLWSLRCPDGGYRILAAVRARGPRFGAPELVSGNARFAAAGAIAIDARGRATALWTRAPRTPHTTLGTVVASDRGSPR